MPLSKPALRREIHRRVIDMQAYARDDGLYDIEVHLVDTKPFEFQRFSTPKPWPAGTPLHDLWLRLTIDAAYDVMAIEASSDVTPFAICKEAEKTLSVLIGQRVAKGWPSRVREKLGGAASCTHLMEMLLPLGTTAYQAINALRPDRITNFESQAHKVIDSCYAYGREREVVQRIWPELIKSLQKP